MPFNCQAIINILLDKKVCHTKNYTDNPLKEVFQVFKQKNMRCSTNLIISTAFKTLG